MAICSFILYAWAFVFILDCTTPGVWLGLTHALLPLPQTPRRQQYDVVIVGGSATGLSAALTLGQSLRDELVVDSGKPCNQNQERLHNFLGFDGASPTRVLTKARADVQCYETIEFQDMTLVSLVHQDISENIPFPWSITMDSLPGNNGCPSQNTICCRKLIIATGVKDVLPLDIKGLEECWGKTAIHCPYCHGYEVQNQQTALTRMDPAVIVVMMTIVARLASCPLCLIGDYESDGHSFMSEELGFLERHKDDIVLLPSHRVVGLNHDDGRIHAVRIRNKDGRQEDIPIGALYLRPRFKHSFPVAQLEPIMVNYADCPGTPPTVLNEKGYISVDPTTQKLAHVPNVYACGDCTDAFRSLSTAIATGIRAAKMLNFELSMEDWKSL